MIPEGSQGVQDIVLGSASPIRFVAMPTTAEILARAASAASEVVIKLGPVNVGLHR